VGRALCGGQCYLTTFLSSFSYCFTQWHFATILSPWIRRGLIAGGFGTGEATHVHEIAPIVPHQYDDDKQVSPQEDVEASPVKYKASTPTGSTYDEASPHHEPVSSLDTPFFHIDVAAAVRAAVRGNSENSETSKK
jgi:sodium-independent sulfate anion transporter 11